MNITRGIPVISVDIKNDDQTFNIKIGDTIQSIILSSDKIIENAILQGIELDFYNAASLYNHNYDNISSYMYRNPNCGLSAITSNKFDIKALAIELPNKSINIIDISEIKSITVLSKEDKEWLENTSEKMNSFIEEIQVTGNITEISINDYEISAVINSSNELNIGLVDFITNTDGIISADYEANNQKFTLIVSKPETYNLFQQGINSTLPKENGKITIGKLTLWKE